MHVLQPKHSKLREEEAKLVLKKFNVTKSQLPRMDKLDPTISSIQNIQSGDIIKIERKDCKNPYYRVVA